MSTAPKLDTMVVGGVVGNGNVVHKMASVNLGPGATGTSACGKTVTRCSGWLGTTTWNKSRIDSTVMTPCAKCAKFDARITFVEVV